MKKNLKKVISAVIALALSLSSVAAFAADASFSDVPADANYYQAVTTLANLGIIAGYEDGTFKPDDNITRAEVTTMVVAAMNMTEQAKSMEGTTQFSDMQSDATKWASGYVNVGVAQKFIAGFPEDNTFRPSENVTYAQIITMLVGALNYGEYATYLGGYPNGYLSIAQTSGITKNVSGNAEDTVTRAQVAMLINNFLDTPKVEMNGISYTADGRLVPNIAIQDGTNDTYYKTVLTENWGIYILEGTISETSKSSESSSLRADQVKFDIDKTKEKSNVNGYNDPSSDDINSTDTTLTVYVGDTDAANYLNSYATAYMQYTEDGDWLIRNFIPSSKNESVKYAASLIDDAEYEIVDTGRSFVRFYQTPSSTRSTKYTFDEYGPKLYVNGKMVSERMTVDDFTKYILNNDAGEVELVDTYSSGSAADGYYDIVNVTYYATARVETVNTNSGRITFKRFSSNASAQITLDDENEDLDYTIKYNGEEIALSDLQEDDVLTISFDPTVLFRDSSFYDITVSRDTVTGKFSSRNDDDRVITLGDSEYEFTELGGEGDVSERFNSVIDDDFKLVLANEYTAYLDVNGRIFDMELSVNAMKIAIVDRVVTSSTYDNYGLTLYTSDGTSKTYEVDSKTTDWGSSQDAIKQVYKAQADGSFVIDNNNKQDVWNRVVEYKVNSRGYITSLNLMSGNRAEGEFKPNTTAVGSIRMSDSTQVIDAINYVTRGNKVADLKVASSSNFVEDSNYVVYGYGDKFNDGTYPFVLVTSGDGKYTENTRFAVVTGTPGQTVTDDGEELYSLTMITPETAANGTGEQEVSYPISDDAFLVYGTEEGKENYIEATDLSKGDLVVYTLDANEQIMDLDVIFKGDEYIQSSKYDTLIDDIMTAGNHSDMLTLPTGTTKWTLNWKEDSDTPAQFVIGPVVEKSGSTFTIGQIKDGKVDGTEYDGPYTDMNDPDCWINVSVDNNTAVYRYSYTANSRNNLAGASTGDIMKCNFTNSQMLSDRTIIPWNTILAEEDTEMYIAIAKVVDGLATEVFILTNANY